MQVLRAEHFLWHGLYRLTVKRMYRDAPFIRLTSILSTVHAEEWDMARELVSKV